MDNLKKFNITAQVFKNTDPTKQNLLINEVVETKSINQAFTDFNTNFPSVDYSLVKILSIEEL